MDASQVVPGERTRFREVIPSKQGNRCSDRCRTGSLARDLIWSTVSGDQPPPHNRNHPEPSDAGKPWLANIPPDHRRRPGQRLCSARTGGKDQSADLLSPPTGGQFSIDTETDPRQLSIFRLGAGAARPSGCWVFEFVDQGQRLRALHKAVLRTEWTLDGIRAGCGWQTPAAAWLTGPRACSLDRRTPALWISAWERPTLGESGHS